jgi:hypothetical protein
VLGDVLRAGAAERPSAAAGGHAPAERALAASARWSGVATVSPLQDSSPLITASSPSSSSSTPSTSPLLALRAGRLAAKRLGATPDTDSNIASSGARSPSGPGATLKRVRVRLSRPRCGSTARDEDSGRPGGGRGVSRLDSAGLQPALNGKKGVAQRALQPPAHLARHRVWGQQQRVGRPRAAEGVCRRRAYLMRLAPPPPPPAAPALHLQPRRRRTPRRVAAGALEELGEESGRETGRSTVAPAACSAGWRTVRKRPASPRHSLEHLARRLAVHRLLCGWAPWREWWAPRRGNARRLTQTRDKFSGGRAPLVTRAAAVGRRWTGGELLALTLSAR